MYLDWLNKNKIVFQWQVASTKHFVREFDVNKENFSGLISWSQLKDYSQTKTLAVEHRAASMKIQAKVLDVTQALESLSHSLLR